MLLGLMILSSIMEVFSLGMVIPFIATMTQPDEIFNNKYVQPITEIFGITTAEEMVLPLTGLFISAAIISALVRLLMLWTSTKLSYSCGADLSRDLFNRTLYQPYQVHVHMNSSELLSGIVNKVGSVTSVINMILQMLNSAVLFSFVLALLLITNPGVTALALTVFGASYIGISYVTRVQLKRNGDIIANESNNVVKALQEGLGGIRDVLLDGTQHVFCSTYRRADLSMRSANANVAIISSSPKYVLDALGIVMIASLAYYTSQQESGLSGALPALGVLALGAQRVLPALQLFYHGWANIFGGQANLKDVLRLLDQKIPHDSDNNDAKALEFDNIKFDHVSFRYGHDVPNVLNDISFEINKGERIGIIGTTGSGKTTIMDLLLGLLEPSSGQVLVNDIPLKGLHKRSWQLSVAHVPQFIYLSDSTIQENIAFGIEREKIDPCHVDAVAKKAQLEGFISSKTEGILTVVGERGIQLSGGQRQRIGIARALYKNTPVLVFDEATSALDSTTEKSVMKTIETLGDELTVIMIAHRISTLSNCDTILEFEQGQLVKAWKFDELVASGNLQEKSTKQKINQNND